MMNLNLQLTNKSQLKGFMTSSTVLRFISLGSFTFLVLCLFLSWISNWNPFFWNIMLYLGPISFLGIWIPYTASFLDLEFESISMKRTLPVAIFGSILIVFGALMLNTRMMYIILNAIIGLFESYDFNDKISQFVIYELILGICGPGIEEFLKILPISIIAHTTLVIWEPGRINDQQKSKKSSILTIRQFGFYGIISGVIFTFLELFLYQWQTIGFGEENLNILFQILLRTMAPLHLLTTFIIAIGIGVYRRNYFESRKKINAFIAGLGYFILGWVLHSTWNSINIYYMIFLPGEEISLYFLLGILGIIINLILLVGIFYISRGTPKICSICDFQEGSIPHIHNKHQEQKFRITQDRNSFFLNLKKYFGFLFNIREKKLKKQLTCPFCHNLSVLGTCSTCGSRTFVMCPSCFGFISETTPICNHCGRKIIPLVELRTKSFNLCETLILGISALASIAFLIAPVSVLYLSQFSNFGARVIPILIFYFLMSIVILVNISVVLFINRTSGILVLFGFFLEFSLLCFMIFGGFFLIGFFRALLLQDIIGLILILIGLLIIIFVTYRFLTVFFINYNPIFMEYELTMEKEK